MWSEPGVCAKYDPVRAQLTGRQTDREGGSSGSVRNTTASVRNRESSPPYFPPLHTHSKIYISDKHLVKQPDEHISIQRNNLEMI